MTVLFCMDLPVWYCSMQILLMFLQFAKYSLKILNGLGWVLSENKSRKSNRLEGCPVKKEK